MSLWLIPACPLAGALLNMVFGRVIGRRAHWIAATVLFICIIAVVWSNHLARREDPTYQNWWAKNVYAVVIALMGLVLLTTAVMLVTGWAYRVTFVEAGLILAFAVFWAIQTSDLKTYANRKEKAAKEPLGKK